MLSFLVRRIFRLVAVLIAITLVSFAFMLLIPGDPVALRLGDHASPEQIADLRREFGLDRPWFVQLGLYFMALLHGDLGGRAFPHDPARLDVRTLGALADDEHVRAFHKRVLERR